MRFVLAVAIAAAAAVPIFGRVSEWIGLSSLLALLYLMAAAAGAGFFSGRRSALAGFLAIWLGAFAAGLVFYPLFVLPYAISGAVSGALGGWLRGWTVRA